MSIRVHRKAFPATKLLACYRGPSLSRIFPILWQTGLFMRLHSTIGCYNRRRTSRRRHGFQFSWIQILFADHVHRRSGVYKKFSFLWFKGWWRRLAPVFRRWKECCFFFSLNLGIFLANLHAASRAHRSCHSVSSWDRSSNLEHWGYADEDHLGKSFQAMDSGLECWHDVPRPWWTEHIGLASVSLSSSAKSL